MTSRKLCQPRERAEDGNLIVLGLGVWVVVISLILILASVIHVYGVRRDMLNAADSLALELAQDISDATYYSGPALSLTPAPPASGTLTVDGREVRFRTRVADDAVVVELTRRARIPFMPQFASAVDEVELTVTSTARLRQMP
ncbi:hypothetical protein R3J22_07025 [Trueperella bernardiae]|uniref:hypothetical protein n=1 Tax=Trueperella bernardiae TaxID=59561 RepID=UPI00294A1EEA|nr:hypothetical protein [Trueperella bernardiae]MDV6239276.1 hypothetical protein [Trueperella bernardiae]